MPGENQSAIPTESLEDANRFRVWIDGPHKEEVEALQLRLGVLAGGIVISRDRVVNVLIREAIEARAAKAEIKKVKSRAKRSRAKSVRHNDRQT